MWVNKQSDIKVVVFDLNGTIAERISDHPKHIAYRNHYILSNSNIDRTDLLPSSTTKALQAAGLSPLEYYIHRNHEIDWSLFHQYSSEVNTSLNQLKEQGYKLVLYTDCHAIQVRKTLELLQLLDTFDLVISAEYNMKKPSPKAYEFIMKEFELQAEEIVIIGNDFDMDILPLLLMNGNGILIKSKKELPMAVEKILTLMKHEQAV